MGFLKGRMGQEEKAQILNFTAKDTGKACKLLKSKISVAGQSKEKVRFKTNYLWALQRQIEEFKSCQKLKMRTNKFIHQKVKKKCFRT